MFWFYCIFHRIKKVLDNEIFMNSRDTSMKTAEYKCKEVTERERRYVLKSVHIPLCDYLLKVTKLYTPAHKHRLSTIQQTKYKKILSDS